MTPLLVDGLIAATKLLDRALSAVENVRHRVSQPVAGAQPAAGLPPQAGGGPFFDPEQAWTAKDSPLNGWHKPEPEELLLQAAIYLQEFAKVTTEEERRVLSHRAPYLPSVESVRAGLRDLAAQFAADNGD